MTIIYLKTNKRQTIDFLQLTNQTEFHCDHNCSQPVFHSNHKPNRPIPKPVHRVPLTCTRYEWAKNSRRVETVFLTRWEEMKKFQRRQRGLSSGYRPVNCWYISWPEMQKKYISMRCPIVQTFHVKIPDYYMWHLTAISIQECIPVGFVPPACWSWPIVSHLSEGRGIGQIPLDAEPPCSQIPQMQMPLEADPPGCRPSVMWPVMHAGKPTSLWTDK